jgi:alpha-L-fucosidase
MFIHFGMSTFSDPVTPASQPPASTYAPDRLDVDQWVRVARDAGMKYAVLTTKHVAGHCLWPTKHTDYSVANSANRTDVVEAFVQACEKRGVLPGLYYCSEDYHHRFGGRCRDEAGGVPFTTSLYQTFQTAQITDLVTQYGPIAEMWIDIPGILGRGYRTFLYHYIGQLQPDALVMMNNGDFTRGEQYNTEYAWPSDLFAIERNVPPPSGHQKRHRIEGKEYYLPGEVCDPIGKEWFYMEGDRPRSDAQLVEQFQACRNRGVNFLLNVPPD